MTDFKWQDIDDRIVQLKRKELAEKMHEQAEADTRRIYFENQGNLNEGSVHLRILEARERQAEIWALGVYELYCEVWRIQGRAKSSAFVRAVAPKALTVLS